MSVRVGNFAIVASMAMLCGWMVLTAAAIACEDYRIDREMAATLRWVADFAIPAAVLLFVAGYALRVFGLRRPDAPPPPPTLPRRWRSRAGQFVNAGILAAIALVLGLSFELIDALFGHTPEQGTAFLDDVATIAFIAWLMSFLLIRSWLDRRRARALHPKA
jgi:hypothetical protein